MWKWPYMETEELMTLCVKYFTNFYFPCSLPFTLESWNQVNFPRSIKVKNSTMKSNKITHMIRGSKAQEGLGLWSVADCWPSMHKTRFNSQHCQKTNLQEAFKQEIFTLSIFPYKTVFSPCGPRWPWTLIPLPSSTFQVLEYAHRLLVQR